MAIVEYNLGGVALDYCSFQWPFYRGTYPRIVIISQGAKRFEEFAALPYITYLEITAPVEAGRNAQADTLRIDNIRLLRVDQVDDMVCRLTLADSRIDLMTRVMPADFLLKFKDGYLEDTDHTTLKAALEYAAGEIDKLGANVGGEAYARVLARSLPDGWPIAGSMTPAALALLLDVADSDMTVTPQGRIRYTERRDIGSDDAVPRAADYDWRRDPGWDLKASRVLGRPLNIDVYYPERHTLLVQTTDDATVVAGDELAVSLEQVYQAGDQYYTLEGLLDAYGVARTGVGGGYAVSDALIAYNFMSENFEKTGFPRDGSANVDAVLKAIKNDWRRLWRIKFTGVNGGQGGWGDWVFGRQDADGNVTGSAVECDFVEFLNVVEPAPGTDTILGAVTAANRRGIRVENGQTEPRAVRAFAATWANEAEGIIRLNPGNDIQDGNFVMPGQLTSELRVTAVGQMRDDQGNLVTLPWVALRALDRSEAVFTQDLDLRIYLTATRRLPNTVKRWHRERVEGFPDGDYARVELEVGQELFCVRDFVDPARGKLGDAVDGLGAVLNSQALIDDAARRAEVWKISNGARAAGEGEVESIDLLLDRYTTGVAGAIDEMILNVDDEVVSTIVRIGNLAGDKSRLDVAKRRIARRAIEAAGKKLLR